MSEPYKPATDFTAGLGIDFKRAPYLRGGLWTGEEARRHMMGLALGELQILKKTTAVEKVHIPGTPIFSRNYLGLVDEREDEGAKSMQVGVYRADIVDKNRQRTRFDMTKLFSAGTSFSIPDIGRSLNEGWEPLSYTDPEGNLLEGREDLYMAAVLLEAATRKPAKRQNKLIVSFWTGKV